MDEEPFLKTVIGVEFYKSLVPTEKKFYVGVEKWKGRKNYSLGFSLPDENCHRTLAYFKSDDDAMRFAEFLRFIMDRASHAT